MSLSDARIVVVTRRTNLEALIERHGTEGQARFWVECRGQSFEEILGAHRAHVAGVMEILRQIPADRRRARVDRSELDRFLFAPDDVVLVVGQDGLVPNVAKYLSGQRVIGVNPDPTRNDGVLCRHAPSALTGLLAALSGRGALRIESRTMAVAEREDGQRLYALNELFIGHLSHQSARYTLSVGGRSERQSSSGIVCATGTGATGWALSIARQRALTMPLPLPEERALAWLVREPFPSRITGTTLDHGRLDGAALRVSSEMSEGGVVFADGMEWDAMELGAGRSIRVGASETPLNLVV